MHELKSAIPFGLKFAKPFRLKFAIPLIKIRDTFASELCDTFLYTIPFYNLEGIAIPSYDYPSRVRFRFTDKAQTA